MYGSTSFPDLLLLRAEFHFRLEQLCGAREGPGKETILNEVAISPAAGSYYCGYWSGSSVYAPCYGLWKMTAFVVGEKFGSYEDLQKKVDVYQKEKYVQLNHRDLRMLDAASKRVPKRVEIANKKLCYYMVHLACVFGGKKV